MKIKIYLIFKTHHEYACDQESDDLKEKKMDELFKFKNNIWISGNTPQHSKWTVTNFYLANGLNLAKNKIINEHCRLISVKK